MKDKIALFVSGIFLGLGLFESLGGYLGIANDVSSKVSPWFGLLNGVIFYIVSIIALGIHYLYMRKRR